MIEPIAPSYADVLSFIEEDTEGAQLVRFKSTKEAMPILSRVGIALVLCYVPDKKQIINQIGMLKVLRRAIKKGDLKIVLVTSFKKGNIIREFEKLGCADVLSEPVPGRMLQFKIKRHISGIQQKMKIAAKAQELRDGRKKNQGDGGPTADANSEIKFIDPLDLEGECFLAKGGGGKAIMGRWRIRLTGPSPASGRWTEWKPGESRMERYWVWTANDPENDPFKKEEGQWIFKGYRPEFQERKWAFVGKSPEFTFREGENIIATKFRVDEEGNLLVAKDSKKALANIPAILKSLEDFEKFEALQEKEKKKEGEDNDETFERSSGGSEGESEDYLNKKEQGQGSDLKDGRGEDEESERDWNDQVGEDAAKSKEKDYQDQAEGKSGNWNDGVTKDSREDAESPEQKASKEQGSGELNDKREDEEEKESKELSARQSREEGADWNESDSKEDSESGKSKKSSKEETLKKEEREKKEETSSESTQKQSKNQSELEAESEKQQSRSKKDGSIEEESTEAEEGRSADLNEEKEGAEKERSSQQVSRDSESETSSPEGATSESREQKAEDGGGSDAAVSKETADQESSKESNSLDKEIGSSGKDENSGESNSDALLGSKGVILAKPTGAPSKPTLSPIALTFLMSELTTKQDVALSYFGNRFCSYLSSAMGGLRIELWSKNDEDWHCIGTSDGSDGQREDAVVNFTAESDTQSSAKDVFVAKVTNLKGDVTGGLVFSGEEATQVPPDYAMFVAQATSGLVQASSYEMRSKKAA